MHFAFNDVLVYFTIQKLRNALDDYAWRKKIDEIEIVVLTVWEDAREGLEAKVVCEAERQQRYILFRWRVLGGQGRGKVGIMP